MEERLAQLQAAVEDAHVTPAGLRPIRCESFGKLIWKPTREGVPLPKCKRMSRVFGHVIR